MYHIRFVSVGVFVSSSLTLRYQHKPSKFIARGISFSFSLSLSLSLSSERRRLEYPHKPDTIIIHTHTHTNSRMILNTLQTDTGYGFSCDTTCMIHSITWENRKRGKRPKQKNRHDLTENVSTMTRGKQITTLCTNCMDYS